MIRSFRPAGGSTMRDGLGERRQHATRARRSPRARPGTSRGARARRPPRPASRAPSTKAPASSRTSSQVRSGPRSRRAVRVMLATSPSSDRRMASRPRRIRLLTVPSGVAGPLGDLLLGQAAEVGELDRLALDVGQRGEGLADGLGIEARPRPRPRRRAASELRAAARPRARAARSSGGGAGWRRSPGDGRSTAARSSRCRGPRCSGRHCATRPRKASWTTSSARVASFVMR